MRQAQLKVAAKDYEDAASLVLQIKRDSPEWLSGQFILGESMMVREQYADACELFESLFSFEPQALQEDPFYFAALCKRELGHLSVAEDYFQKSARRFPQRLSTHENLAFILSGSGRIWEAAEHFSIIVRAGDAGLAQLALLADLERPVEQRELFEAYKRQAPNDPVVALGLAAHDFWEGNPDIAEVELREIVSQFPERLDAQAMLGELLVEADRRQFGEWFEQLPVSRERHPGVWYVCGMYARRSLRLDLAAQCFERTLILAPTHRRAAWQLSQVLHSLGRDDSAAVEKYAERLLNLSAAVDNVLRTVHLLSDRVQDVVRLLEESGRIWEASGWSLLAMQQLPDEVWPREFFARTQDRLTDDLPMVVLLETPVIHFVDREIMYQEFLAELADSAGPSSASVRSGGVRSGGVRSGGIRFDDTEVSLSFAFNNGNDPSTPGARMFEQTGGGVAVVDFDSDNWPDLFLPQGGTYDERADSFVRDANNHDTIFVNRRGEFTEVTSLALPHDIGFGQGASVGDINNDGFADLYVGNIGRNQLLMNMGDGTFVEATSGLGADSPDQWTASTAIADLNSDGLPDLVDVNYLEGQGIFSAICGGKACSPSVFNAAPDCLRQNLGDGTFLTTTGVLGSKGFGCVVFKSAGDSGSRMFITSDQVANVLLEFSSAATIRFAEVGLQSGLAFNEDGISMGCMGVAAEDVTGNGMTDLFVTNFLDEPNTLYLQDSPDLFIDRTRSSGIFQSSYPLVGWGTQFLDANRDGHPDLVVTNGHVDDYRDDGGEYHMRPQFFQNLGSGAFKELNSDSVGDYFGARWLGRGLAKWDWNRDGAVDFVVSNIGQPVSVVTNRSPASGHYLNVRLHGTISARDAVGTTIKVVTDGQSWTRQLLAGDGYMASNERTLQFGLGGNEHIQTIEVRWPSGQVSTFGPQSVDQTLHFVEGRSGEILSVW